MRCLYVHQAHEISFVISVTQKEAGENIQVLATARYLVAF
jgi:hypothetical protein